MHVRITLTLVFLTAAPALADPPAEIRMDYSEVPEMQEWAEKVQRMAEEWYPRVVEELKSDGFTAPQRVSITIKKDMKGVAGTSAAHISCAAEYFKKHPEDIGAVLHELVHVVQSYHGHNPGWLVEGIADYVRFFWYEPPSQRPRPDPVRSKYI